MRVNFQVERAAILKVALDLGTSSRFSRRTNQLPTATLVVRNERSYILLDLFRRYRIFNLKHLELSFFLLLV